MDMDAVSALPDELLVSIISLLPLRDMVRTAFLSRRWRRVWTAVLAFNFTDADDDDVNVYISRIDRCLERLSASPSCTTIPSIIFPGIQDSDAVSRWIRFAAAHDVANLEFAIWTSNAPPVPLSLSLFQLCRGLTALDISNYKIPAVPAPAVSPAFPSLRSLTLFDVAIAGPQAFFAHCPVIERLSVDLLDEAALLPASAFSSCPRLSTLSLANCTVPREPRSAVPPAFPSLHAIELESVRVASLHSLLNSCPVVAELTIRNPPEGFTFRLDPRHTVSTLRPFPPSPSPSLDTLVLSDLKIADLPALVRAFQGLEILSLDKVRIKPRADSGIQLRAPRMTHLMVQDSKKLGHVVVMDTPQLCCLFYWGDIRYLRVSERAVPKLEAAFLHSTVKNPFGGKYHLWKSLMKPLSHVRLLSVNWWFICEFMQRCPIGSEQLIFDKLKEFHWWPVFKKNAVRPFAPWYTERLSPIVVLSLLDFLKCCPNIEHLCVVSTYAILESPPLAVPSAEENEDEFLIKMANSTDFNQTEGLQIVQRVLDISQSSLPQLKKFTMYQFSGRPGDICLLYFVGLRGRALQHIHLHCVQGSRAATPSIQSPVRRYFSTCSPHASLQFLECSSHETCLKHEELWRHKLCD